MADENRTPPHPLTLLEQLSKVLPKEKFEPTPLDENADRGLFERVKDIFG